MKKILSLVVLVGIVFVMLTAVVLPYTAEAAETSALFDFNLWRGTGDGGVNTCNLGKPCTFCDAIVIISNLISIVFSASLVIGAVMVAVGGFYYIIDPINPGLKKKGQDMMKNAGIGLLIIVLAYPFTSFVLRTLIYDGDTHTVSNLMPWSELTCK